MPPDETHKPKPPPTPDAAIWELTTRMATIQAGQERMTDLLDNMAQRYEHDREAQAFREKRMITAIETLATKVESVGTRFQLIFLLVVVGGVATFLLVKGLLNVNYFMGLMVMMLTPFFGEGAVKIIRPYVASRQPPPATGGNP